MLPADQILPGTIVDDYLAASKPVAQLRLPKSVYVPNKVLAFWGGNLAEAGAQALVGWQPNITELKRKGFNVDEKNNRLLRFGHRFDAADFYKYIETQTKSGVLQGVFFWGHGNRYNINLFGFQTLVNIGEVYGLHVPLGALGIRAPRILASLRYTVDYAGWQNAENYKLGLGIIYACEGDYARPIFSDNAVFEGSCGTLNPFQADKGVVARLLANGKQGTNQ